MQYICKISLISEFHLIYSIFCLSKAIVNFNLSLHNYIFLIFSTHITFRTPR